MYMQRMFFSPQCEFISANFISYIAFLLLNLIFQFEMFNFIIVCAFHFCVLDIYISTLDSSKKNIKQIYNCEWKSVAVVLCPLNMYPYLLFIFLTASE